jgi:hypothetical protein
MTNLPQFNQLLIVFLCATLLGACEDTGFSGSGGAKANANNGKKPGDNRNNNGDQTGFDTDGKPDAGDSGDSNGGSDAYTHDPITPDLGGGGWVGKEGFPDLKELFGDDSGISSGPGGPDAGGPDAGGPDAGGPDGPGGSDSADGGSISDSGKSNNAGSGGDTQSGGRGDVPGWSDGENGVFWMPCNDDKGGGAKSGSIKGPLGADVRVAGELCPAKSAEGALTVLFVVDYSGSMTGIIEGPNDPGDNCGRLRAADALLKKFSGPDYKGYDLKFGLVGFSTDSSVRLPFQNLQAMQGTLNAGTWCGSDSALALTNYNAAFTVSQQALTGVQGRTVIYFISDGSPTTGGEEQGGLDAANALKTAMGDNLVINAVFLGYNGSKANPQGYLEQITGDPKRVRVVDGADALVDAVQELDTGLPKIEKSAVKATLTANGSTTDVALDTVKPHKKKAGAFIYMTKPFTLKGEVGKETVNEISVKGKTDDDKSVSAKATITFKATE